MYCVIQEVENKKTNSCGAYKELKVNFITWTINGETKIKYSYNYAGEIFERPIRKAYKISIHESYRENGKVKKKQWSICTMGYYGLIESWPGDCILQSKLNEKLQEMDRTEDELWDMVYKKLDPIIEEVQEEFHETEECKISQKHRKIIKEYNRSKEEFESLYGQDTYDYCYDVFGTLRNEGMLNRIKKQYENYQEQQSRYYEDFKSNYNSNQYDFGSLSGSSSKTYSDNEKKYLKKIYKAAAMILHPDKAGGSDEGMQFLNKLKEEWGI